MSPGQKCQTLMKTWGNVGSDSKMPIIPKLWLCRLVAWNRNLDLVQKVIIKNALHEKYSVNLMKNAHAFSKGVSSRPTHVVLITCKKYKKVSSSLKQKLLLEKITFKASQFSKWFNAVSATDAIFMTRTCNASSNHPSIDPHIYVVSIRKLFVPSKISGLAWEKWQAFTIVFLLGCENVYAQPRPKYVVLTDSKSRRIGWKGIGKNVFSTTQCSHFKPGKISRLW